MPSTLRKLSLTVLNSLLILTCLAIVTFATYTMWGGVGLALYTKIAGTGFVWLIAGLAVWVFGTDIKTIWEG